MYRDVIGTLHLLGRQGVSVIAAAGLDMAIWDALAKAAGLPLAELLGGTVGKIRTYNTNGLWLLPLDKLAKEARELVDEANFSAIKIRLGRPKLADDLKALSNGAIGAIQSSPSRSRSRTAMRRCRTVLATASSGTRRP